MRAESGGEMRAVSPKGAMGLMQIMPDTWAELRSRYGLGADPYDPHDNIMAGTAYLRELHDRYGERGFLAAYNAGPERYEDHLATGRPLPAETLSYMTAVASLLGARMMQDGRECCHVMGIKLALRSDYASWLRCVSSLIHWATAAPDLRTALCDEDRTAHRAALRWAVRQAVRPNGRP